MNEQADLHLCCSHSSNNFSAGGREAQANMEKCREWKLSTVDPQERSTWRSVVRSAMHAASQLPGVGPLMWMMPLHLHFNQKSDYDDYEDDDCSHIGDSNCTQRLLYIVLKKKIMLIPFVS